MPGIIGFLNPDIAANERLSALMGMRDLIDHEATYTRDELFTDAYLSASGARVGTFKKAAQPYHHHNLYVWMDGEFYNRKEVGLAFGIDAAHDHELLASIFQRDDAVHALAHLDGFYSACIYDVKRRQVHLLTDRYGLRHLYWTIQRGTLSWGSEVKALLASPGFTPRLDPQGIKEFLAVGYMMEDRTWLEDVSLLASGTMLTWDIDTRQARHHRYWWWDAIQANEGPLRPMEVAEELGRLFVDACRRRSAGSANVGLTLSGGLDSRAILAAMPENPHGQIAAVTFGKPGCDDIRIAAEVTRVKGASHHSFELNENNWLDMRLQGVWWTDGHVNIKHLHGIEFRDSIKALFDINMNGFAGDLILGGSYLTGPSCLDQPIDAVKAANMMGCSADVVPDLTSYRDLPKSDFFFIQNRVRRFTIGGTRHSQTSIDHRKPFFDNKLIEFTYSLPDRLRYKNQIYAMALLNAFPAYFETIPWQKTGVPISYPTWKRDLAVFSGKVKNKLVQGAVRMGLPWSTSSNYTNYPQWLRNPASRAFIDAIFTNRDAIYPAYIARDMVLAEWASHLQGEDKSEIVCRYLTIEIWLQQIYQNEYRRGLPRLTP